MLKNMRVRYVLPPCLLIALLVVIYFLPQAHLFSFERDLIEQGQWWRLLTGQLVHWTVPHLIMNCLGIVVLWLLYAEHAPGWYYPLVVLVCALGSNLGMYWLAPSVHYYVGFSGAIYGLFAWGAWQDIRYSIRLGWFLLLGVMLKVSWEYFIGPIGARAELAVQAHFFGALSGLAFSLLYSRLRLFSQ